MNHIKIYVASAGTGKTTALLQDLEETLKHTKPERICFTTFTNVGANEAIERACSKFNLNPNRFPYFRTLHSLCYRNIQRLPMMTYQDYKQFGKSIDIATTGYSALSNREGTIKSESCRGDVLLALDSLQRNTRKTAIEVCSGTNERPETLEHFSKSLKLFKESIHKIDFTDQLEMFLADSHTLDIDYLFVDESQDFSKLQWEIIDKLGKRAKSIIIAGDDKQAIFEFAGASPESLINHEGSRVLLGNTYRLPEKILEYSTAIADRLSNKTPYKVKSVKTGGLVERIRNLNDLDMSEGSWLCLVRNRAFATYFDTFIFQKNLAFTTCSNEALVPSDTLECIASWNHLLEGGMVQAKDVKKLYSGILPTKTKVAFGNKAKVLSLDDSELLDLTILIKSYGLLTKEPWQEAFNLPEKTLVYLKNLEAMGQLDKKPRIEVATIHSVKGREADHVIILPDLTHQTEQNFLYNPDSEHRAFYVAATRAKETLYLHEAITNKAYPL